ncbi:MAG: hypothetical protein Barrevirus36_2 [Barrevirus sp.]|uniref:Uncharacterized protein n=1 Tax=Barrevirus sp. TaxID=2487763 RepID=A0A3G4ZQZ4_9VIRU|nr:MAG: hypothetical protein Barrevirus36_2 [Barrevirus sp.]
MIKYQRVTKDDNDYIVFPVRYKGINLPVLIDYDDFLVMKKLDNKWKCNNNGFVFCQEGNRDYYLHELIMSLKNKDEGLDNELVPIIHINRIGLDNRRENLIYDIADKDINKNTKKKKRTVVLPKNCGIKPNMIPTYIWYMKPDQTHGERFMVSIGDIMWKTTSSNDLSLKYKLEEAKMFLRHLLRERPDLMDLYSMNGDLNREGLILANSYYDIVHDIGYNHIKKVVPDKNTLDLLKPDYDCLDEDELDALDEARKYI